MLEGGKPVQSSRATSGKVADVPGYTAGWAAHRPGVKGVWEFYRSGNTRPRDYVVIGNAHEERGGTLSMPRKPARPCRRRSSYQAALEGLKYPSEGQGQMPSRSVEVSGGETSFEHLRIRAGFQVMRTASWGTGQHRVEEL